MFSNLYFNFLRTLQENGKEVYLVNKIKLDNYEVGTRFKIYSIVFNESIRLQAENTNHEPIFVPLDERIMKDLNSTFNKLFQIVIENEEEYSPRIHPAYLEEKKEVLELTEIQEDFLREYTYILKAKNDLGCENFIKGKEYHVVKEVHSKNEHLVYIANEKGFKHTISCTREDFQNPDSFINNFEFLRRKGSHEVLITTSETSILEDEQLLRQEKEDLLHDIIEYPNDYKIVCKESVENEDYHNDWEDCEDEEPFCFIAGKVYFGDLSQLDEDKLELFDEMTRVNGIKHIVINDIEEFFDEDSWFNTHFEIVER